MTPIINAKDIEFPGAAILAWGQSGTGKTTGILTLPRPTLVFALEPQAWGTLAGQDIDIITYPIDDVNLNPGGMISKRSENAVEASRIKAAAASEKGEEPKVYLNFRSDIKEGLRKKLFDNYASIAVDSITALTKLAMDWQIWVASHPSGVPEKDDYNPVMSLVYNTLRLLSGAFVSPRIVNPVTNEVGLGKILYVTAHEDRKEVKDQQGNITQVLTSLSMIGQSKNWGPGVFTDVCRTTHRAGKFFANFMPPGTGGPTKCSRLTRAILEKGGEVELTIGDWMRPEEYGFGKLLKGGTK